MGVTKRDFGRTKDGRAVTCWRVEGAGGLVLEALDWGGKIVRLETPDAAGARRDVVLGFDSPAGWEAGDAYYGALIGRYANRIGAGKFSLDGTDYTLVCNNAPAGIPCSLHGADGGWHVAFWNVAPFEKPDGDMGLVFTRRSPAGEGGYPGNVDVKVVYTVTPANVWRVEYAAETDAATPISLTQHVYFNFKGEGGGSVEDHELQVMAENFLPYDASQVPTGEVKSVAGTPFDFRTPHLIGERIDADDAVLKAGKGYDHCWVVDGTGLRSAAVLRAYGRRLEVWTSEPGVQIYTGNWIPDGQSAKGADKLSCRCGVALETGHFPDSPNKPQFPNTILRPGEKLSSVTEFRFSAE